MNFEGLFKIGQYYRLLLCNCLITKVNFIVHWNVQIYLTRMKFKCKRLLHTLQNLFFLLLQNFCNIKSVKIFHQVIGQLLVTKYLLEEIPHVQYYLTNKIINFFRRKKRHFMQQKMISLRHFLKNLKVTELTFRVLSKNSQKCFHQVLVRCRSRSFWHHTGPKPHSLTLHCHLTIHNLSHSFGIPGFIVDLFLHTLYC